MAEPRPSSVQRRLQIERLRLRAQLERQQAIRSVQRVRRGLSGRRLWHSLVGNRSSLNAASLIMPAMAMWRRYPYLLGSTGSILGALLRGRARVLLPAGALGVLLWRVYAGRTASRDAHRGQQLPPEH